MLSKTYIVTRIELLKMSARRGVVFLCCQEDNEIDAAVVFAGLDDKKDRDLRSRFEHWIDGGTNNKWFHGFNEEGYRECFVFKWKAKRQHHRLYGFLCHPMPRTNRRFQLCVLVSHAKKNQRETNKTELDGVKALRSDSSVYAAITTEFPDNGGSEPWVN